MIALIIVLLMVSTVVVAALLYRLMGQREKKVYQEVLKTDTAEAELSRLDKIRRSLGFMLGPFPLSVALHVLALTLLIISVHEQRGRELIMVNLEAGGGGGDIKREMECPPVP